MRERAIIQRITPEMLTAAVAANVAGMSIRTIAEVMRCSERTLTRALDHHGRTKAQERRAISLSDRRHAGQVHSPALILAAAAAIRDQPSAPSRVRERAKFKPATTDTGARIYVTPAGISLPWINSIYGEARA